RALAGGGRDGDEVAGALHAHPGEGHPPGRHRLALESAVYGQPRAGVDEQPAGRVRARYERLPDRELPGGVSGAQLAAPQADTSRLERFQVREDVGDVLLDRESVHDQGVDLCHDSRVDRAGLLRCEPEREPEVPALAYEAEQDA